MQVIASIWPSSISLNTTTNTKPIADLNTFLHHILKHSRTTHSTLQLAIFYLFRIRSNVQQRRNEDVYISCGRRMFLAALISAHKYLQDKTYKNSAWSKVSGLAVQEINHAEKVLLELLDYRLYVKKDTYDQWISMLQSHLKVKPTANNNATTATTTQLPPSPIASPTSSPSLLLLAKRKLQHEQQLLAIQQSLPSPPLEEPITIHIKRKLDSSSFVDERMSKKHCC